MSRKYNCNDNYTLIMIISNIFLRSHFKFILSYYLYSSFLVAVFGFLLCTIQISAFALFSSEFFYLHGSLSFPLEKW